MPSSPGWPEAVAIAAGALGPPRHVHRTPVDAIGHALAEPLRSKVDRPWHDQVAMDGWAVRAEPPWRIIGQVGPAHAVTRLAPGEAVSVSTGAALPAGATATLRTEDGLVDRSWLWGRDRGLDDVRSQGEECRRGDELVPFGTPITPVVAGLAAATGHDTITVHDLPRVGLVITGDELERSGVPREGRSRDALGPLFAGWLLRERCEIVGTRWVADDTRATVEAVGALSETADIVLTTGATARGRSDHVRNALDVLGARLLVDGVLVRPGHPMMLAQSRGSALICALPGNPLAAVAAYLTLVRPMIRTWQAPLEPLLTTAPAPSERRGHGRSWRMSFERDGHEISAAVGSAMLLGLARADLARLVPPNGLSPQDESFVLPVGPR